MPRVFYMPLLIHCSPLCHCKCSNGRMAGFFVVLVLPDQAVKQGLIVRVVDSGFESLYGNIGAECRHFVESTGALSASMLARFSAQSSVQHTILDMPGRPCIPSPLHGSPLGHRKCPNCRKASFFLSWTAPRRITEQEPVLSFRERDYGSKVVATHIESMVALSIATSKELSTKPSICRMSITFHMELMSLYLTSMALMTGYIYIEI